MSESHDIAPIAAWQPYRALYIHVPFCKQRCLYCDFATQACAPDDPRLDAYVDDLVRDIRAASRAEELGHIETVYLGGGTPTYLGNARLSRILYALSLSMHLTPEVECTLEANPESLTGAMVRDSFALGATRISMGVQSFDDDLLRTIGRIHSADDARRAIARAQERFENVSIDLMCGLPGQTIAGFERDLDEALALGVKHVSVYPLMVEDGTPLARLVDTGTLAIDEDDGADYMVVAAERLAAAGMHRYEVASYAYPGFESRHNTAYWTGVPYLGLGPGAVSMRQDDLTRERFEGSHVIESLDLFERTAEDLMLGMRMSRGVSDEMVEDAAILLPEAPAAFAELAADGLVEHRDGRWLPTERGWLFGNRLYGRLLDLAP